jgi:glycine betaine/proline transport system ATP-binding protein
MTDKNSTAPAIAVEDLWQVFGENAAPALRDARGAGDDKAIAQALKDMTLFPPFGQPILRSNPANSL